MMVQPCFSIKAALSKLQQFCIPERRLMATATVTALIPVFKKDACLLIEVVIITDSVMKYYMGLKGS